MTVEKRLKRVIADLVKVRHSVPNNKENIIMIHNLMKAESDTHQALFYAKGDCLKNEA